MNDKDFSLLVVDDVEDNRDVLAHRLKKFGYHVETASSGPEALEQIKQKAFDLILLDVMMPGMDGLEVLAHIREMYSLVELPVIIVTARDGSGDVSAALQLGANDYVVKPINFTITMARVQNQLAIRRATRAKPLPRTSPEIITPVMPAPATREASVGDTSVGIPEGAVRSTASGLVRLGEYELVGEMGRGGMGVVYKARHARLNRLAAIKIIDKEFLKNPSAVARFYQEAESAAKLSHPNVVMAYDASQQGDTHFFVMEFVDGKDLERLVREQGPLPIVEACDYIRQAALGLQHAFEKGLVHRDIKPSNLLIVQGEPADAVVKVLDFGLARMVTPVEGFTPGSGLTGEGKVIGTADYMAPEQWMNASKVDIRADLYSLGCTFYFLLTGKAPFAGCEPMEKMLKHHLEEPAPVEQLRPDVPPVVRAVVRRLMAKKPETRFAMPAEVAETLKRFLAVTTTPLPGR